jgi:hypothetical protein
MFGPADSPWGVAVGSGTGGLEPVMIDGGRCLNPLFVGAF